MTQQNEIHKVCTSCHKNLPLSAYGNHAKGKYGKRSQCRECRSAAIREHKGTDLRLCATEGCFSRVNGFGYCCKCLDKQVHVELKPVLAKYGFRMAEVKSEAERVEGVL